MKDYQSEIAIPIAQSLSQQLSLVSNPVINAASPGANTPGGAVSYTPSLVSPISQPVTQTETVPNNFSLYGGGFGGSSGLNPGSYLPSSSAGIPYSSQASSGSNSSMMMLVLLGIAAYFLMK